MAQQADATEGAKEQQERPTMDDHYLESQLRHRHIT